MIFAAATDENVLYVFGSAEAAIAKCEGIDVEDGGWRFWDAAGHALQAEFLVPNLRHGRIVGNGTYRLVRSAGKATLAEAIDGFSAFDGRPRFDGLDALRAHLRAVAPAAPGT